jgi:NADH oxidase (H2O2-forming)
VLADYLAGRIPREQVFLRTGEDYDRAGLELRAATRVAAWEPERNRLRCDSGEIAYDRLVLATGSRPVIPRVPGCDMAGVFTLKTLADADLLREARGRCTVVVGSGPVGIETALALRARGWSVAVMEMLDRLLPRLFDQPLAATLQSHLESSGISVSLGEELQEIVGNERVRTVRTNRRTLPADLVVWVVGMRPELALIDRGQVDLGPFGGIAVDAGMRTSRENVWACGDCVESEELATGRRGLHMLWNNARVQGRVAGANAAGATRRYPGSLNITTVACGEEAAASAGMLAADVPPEELDIVHRKRAGRELWLVLRRGRLVGVQAWGRTERVGSLAGLLLREDDAHRGAALPWKAVLGSAYAP